MREFDNGQYWVQFSRDQEPEVARYAGEVWLLHGSPQGFDTSDFYRIGRPVKPAFDAFDPE